MIDPITLHILQEQGMIEGYCLKCALCGRVVEMIKDGEGVMSCCNKRMFVMSASPEPASESGGYRGLTEAEDQQLFELVMIENLIFNEAVDKFDRMDKLEAIGEENLSELQLHELKKTRDWATKAMTMVTDPTYRKRKKDLMKLRKTTTGKMRKSFQKKFDILAKKKPGIATKLAKAKEIGGDVIKSTMARRAAAKRLGGYYKFGTIHGAEEEKRIAAKAKEKKAAKAVIKKRKGAFKAKLKHEKQTRKRQLKAHIKKVKQSYKHGTPKKKAPASKKRKYRSSEVKGYGGTSGKKDFNPGKFMSLDSLQLDTELNALLAETEKKSKEGIFDKAKRLGKEGILIKKYVPKEEPKKKVSEAEGMKGLPKGWTQDSLKKFAKNLTGKEGTKEKFFERCVKKMTGKLDNPEGFCASVKDELHGSTYWRGKGKTPQQAGKDVKAHKNVRRG